MRYLRLMVVALALSCTGLCATLTRDYSFENERMYVGNTAIYVVSSLENEDHITAYTYGGLRIWNAPFHAKILAWDVVDDYIFVFSKHRLGFKTYLTCISLHTGELIWQRP